MPLGLVAQGRLYVLGQPVRTAPCRIDSIGPNESTWRREPDGPTGMWALAGSELDGVLFVCAPVRGLVAYSPTDRKWSILGGPAAPRSPQVVAWNSELWIMGGRDIEDGKQVLIYRPSDRTWRKGPSLPRPLAWGAAASDDGAIYLIGGAAGSGTGDNPYHYSDMAFRWTHRG